MSQTTDSSSHGLLDLETLDELRLLDSMKPGLIDQLIQRFEARRLGQIAAIEQAFGEKRWPDITAMAHSLKGGAASLGLVQLSKLAATLEANPQMLASDPGVLGSLSKAMELSMNALREWKGG